MNKTEPGWEKEMCLDAYLWPATEPNIAEEQRKTLEKFKRLKIQLTNKVILLKQSLSCMWHT